MRHSLSSVCCLIETSLDGVYKSGVATTQQAYETAVREVFESLDRVEKLLEGKDYLVGNVLTEADVRLFVTIVSHYFVCVAHTKSVLLMSTP